MAKKNGQAPSGTQPWFGFGGWRPYRAAAFLLFSFASFFGESRGRSRRVFAAGFGGWKPFVIASFLYGKRENRNRPSISQCLTSLILNLPWRTTACKSAMEKAIHSPEYRTFLRLLRQTRQAQGATQIELAERLSKAHRPITQSLVSKLERGEVRLDIIQLRWICRALGVSLVDFAEELEASLSTRAKR